MMISSRALLAAGLLSVLLASGCGGGGADAPIGGFEDTVFTTTIVTPGVGDATVLERINANLVAVGTTVLTGGAVRASSWTPGDSVDLLPFPPGFTRSTARYVNSAGTVVGRAFTDSSNSTPMRIVGGAAETLDWTSVSSTGEAQVVNDAGVIGGVAFGTTTSTLVRRNADSTLSTQGPFNTPVCNSINAAGTIVGSIVTNTGTGAGEAYFWSGNTFTTFSAPGFTFADARDINTAGVIVGRAGRFSEVGRAFVRDTSGTVTLLPNPTGFTNAWATCINDDGVIGGYVADASGNNPEAVMWVDGQPYLLSGNTTVPTGFTLTFVQDITNNGDFLVTVTNGTDDFPALMRPTN